MRRIFSWVFAGSILLFGCLTNQGSDNPGLTQHAELVAALRARGYQFTHELSGGAAAATQPSVEAAQEGQHYAGGPSMAEPGIKGKPQGVTTVISKFDSLSDTELISRLKVVELRIYGTNDQAEPYQARNLTAYVPSVAALFLASNVVDNGDGTFTLRTETFKKRYHLCNSERFENQPVGAFGTAFLVGSNLIVTAGHCIAASDAPKVEDIRVVFGYRMLNDTTAVLTIPAADVYTINSDSSTMHFQFVRDKPGEDWAVLSLNRVCPYKPLALRRRGAIDVNERLVTIGYPSGLPVKIAGNARVTSAPTPKTFSATLDAFGGNSGGPVFNSKGIVEGIVSMGGQDFIFKKRENCFSPLVVPDVGVDGFVCTATAAFSQLVP